MSNPNKTVARAAKSRPREDRPEREREPFMTWLFEQAQAGKAFDTMEAARAAFDAEGGAA